MNKCNGITGYLFGHKIESLMIENSPRFNSSVPAMCSDKIIEIAKIQAEASIKQQPHKYKICCIRCGRIYG